MSDDTSAQLKSEKTKDIRSTNIIAAKGKPSALKPHCIPLKACFSPISFTFD